MKKKKQTVEEILKGWKMPSNKQIKKNMCKVNLSKLIPKRCPVCNSKYLYYDSSAGPIVGGVGTWKHPPNAHPIGAWICLDCAERSYKEREEYKRKQKIKEAPEQIKKKQEQIKKLNDEITELKELIK